MEKMVASFEVNHSFKVYTTLWMLLQFKYVYV